MPDIRKFHIKPFSLSHHNATMRVGTDAMLLGLFAGIPGIKNTLEIGTGCGIISLIIASRFKTNIDAIDLDTNSIKEATENFSKSPFYHRLNALRANFNEYAKTTSTKYDLIISNPPFFINDFRPENEKKSVARHADSLSYDQICAGSIKLLNPGGFISLVLPYDESKVFIEIANKKGLYMQRQQLIIPVQGLQPNRINMELGLKKPEKVQNQEFIIRGKNREFTEEYIALLKDYYIALK